MYILCYILEREREREKEVAHVHCFDENGSLTSLIYFSSPFSHSSLFYFHSQKISVEVFNSWNACNRSFDIL